MDHFDKANEFIETNDIKWPQIITSGDSKISKDYKIDRYPTVFLVNPEGLIIEKGMADKNMEDVLKRYITH